jgi:phosphoenolpyruvate carboxylase
MAAQPPITQNPDIRFLGRLLGDVIRAYGGDALFRRIEYIRSTSVDRARGIVEAHAIDPGLGALSLDDTLAFVRGFMLFSMLANLAEDRQGVAAEPGADVAAALDRLEKEGVGRDTVTALLEKALVVPVLTAHPTEVRRKSMIDHRNRIADLMRLKDAGLTETDDGDVIEQAILRQIALLWQTRPLRRERLYVADEVESALAYMRDIFLPTLPTLYARWQRALGHRPPSFLRPGTWIGGDRDGNPNVNADSLRLALAGRARRRLAVISTSCTRSVPNFRSRPNSPRRHGKWRSLRKQAATAARPDATNPIAARSRASTPVSPQPIASLSARPRRAPPRPRPNLIPTRRPSAPISSRLPMRWRRMAGGCCRAEARSAG